MTNPNSRTQTRLSRQINTFQAELHEKEIEYNLLDAYLNEEPDPEMDRPSDESIERDMTEVLEAREALEARLAAVTRAWSRGAWRELGVRP